jgi:hypothetical protein
MLIKTFTLAAALTGSTASIASAQTVEQHNGPGGPKQRVERIINLPPPPAPTGAPAGSTTTVTSPPAAPAKKN